MFRYHLEEEGSGPERGESGRGKVPGKPGMCLATPAPSLKRGPLSSLPKGLGRLCSRNPGQAGAEERPWVPGLESVGIPSQHSIGLSTASGTQA